MSNAVSFTSPQLTVKLLSEPLFTRKHETT